MCSTTWIVLCFTFLNFLISVHCAPELLAEDSYGIVSTESTIRNTLNNLFSTLNLKVLQNKLKLKQYSAIHNFFASITLRDNNNLKKIAKLTEADNIDNGTRVFIAQLNEVLNEDNKSDEETDSVYVTFLIEDFINRLDYLKDRHDLKNNTKLFYLNEAILRYFNKNEIENTTYSKEEFVNVNDSNDSVLSDSEIWQPSGRRIFDGISSDIHLYPFMVSVKFFRKFQCGGSIIKSDLIITSASCLQIAWNNRFFRENPSFLSVQVGSSYYDHGGEQIPVMEIYYHPSYTPKNLRHNLAIMRLKDLLSFGKRHKRIKKIEFDRHPSPLPSNTENIVVVGWGVKSFGGTSLTTQKTKLSAATLEFYPLNECQDIYSKEFVTDRNFCAGFFSKGGGACNHDAGGPGVSGGILAGIISFGAPVCGTIDAPTVFTKLGYYTNWIEEIMEMEVPSVNQQTTLHTTYHRTFDLPLVTKEVQIKVMPFVNGRPYTNPTEPAVVRTGQERHDFRDFLKTIFKKKKEHKISKEQAIHKKSQEDETEKASDFPSESELTDNLHTTEEETDSQNETQEKKERHMFKVKPILRDKHKTTTEKKNKPTRKPKKKLKRKEKNKWSTAESQNQSKEDSEDKTTSILPSTISETGENSLLLSEDESSSAEVPNSDEKTISSSTPFVDLNKEESTSQDIELDEAIESLINKLKIDYDSESKGSSKKKDFESNLDLFDENKHKGKKRKKSKVKIKLKHLNKKNKHESDSNKKRDKEHDNSEDEGVQENGSDGYKNDEESDKTPYLATKDYERSEQDNKNHDNIENEGDQENGSDGYKNDEQRDKAPNLATKDYERNEHDNKNHDNSEEERDEENRSNRYKNNEQSDKTPNLATKDYERSEHDNKNHDNSEDERDEDNRSNRYKNDEQRNNNPNIATKDYKRNKHDNENHDNSEDEGDDENGSNEYKNNELSDNKSKLAAKDDESTEKIKDVESHSAVEQENAESVEVVHKVNKKNKKKRNKNKNILFKKVEKDKTDDDYKTELSEQENSISNNTDRLIDMLEYEDIYKLLSAHPINK